MIETTQLIFYFTVFIAGLLIGGFYEPQDLIKGISFGLLINIALIAYLLLMNRSRQ